MCCTIAISVAALMPSISTPFTASSGPSSLRSRRHDDVTVAERGEIHGRVVDRVVGLIELAQPQEQPAPQHDLHKTADHHHQRGDEQRADAGQEALAAPRRRRPPQRSSARTRRRPPPARSGTASITGRPIRKFTNVMGLSFHMEFDGRCPRPSSAPSLERPYGRPGIQRDTDEQADAHRGAFEDALAAGAVLDRRAEQDQRRDQRVAPERGPQARAPGAEQRRSGPQRGGHQPQHQHPQAGPQRQSEPHRQRDQRPPSASSRRVRDRHGGHRSRRLAGRAPPSS